jgi:hypothetical protein
MLTIENCCFQQEKEPCKLFYDYLPEVGAMFAAGSFLAY